ncbi:MAG: trimeric intracellular cation channel family protein [Alysiella sp.]|uniref:trimeric intracellular cation channel family protein n=1 Tax=Alysiella sp. TaxID=1872483 RepID=UPI0026DB5F1D|nr:trimeric intracellular cation channel family protein [Alysiella sp.]MDO4433541.1 trimeric intracellular cation channel family protein [Alysiella sp.]
MSDFHTTLPTADSIVYTLDMVGIIACTVAASVLAKRLQFDAFGALMISFIGSVGGGTLRDVLLNRHPIFWLHDHNYLYTICIVSFLVQIFYHYIEKLDRAMRWFDALGLAAFTVIGIEAALARNMGAPIVILMGVFTAVIGGVLRDIVCRQIPLVLQKEIYITASIIGSTYYLLLSHTDISAWFRSITTILLIFVIRMLAIYRQWNLPNITLPKRH